MKISRIGILILVLITIFSATSCNYYSRIMARKNLVDGAKAYNDKQFADAEEKFRSSIAFDPELGSFESKTAQLFLARTIHSEFAINRDKQEKAGQAIDEYQKALKGFLIDLKEKREAVKSKPQDPKVQKELEQTEEQIGSIIAAVGSLYTNLNQEDKWLEWQTTQAANEALPNETRATAYVSLAAKKYSCANDITDVEAIKKTVKEDGKDVFKFVKPESEGDFDKLKECVQKGTEYISKAVELNPESDSAWSYKASLIEQNRRVADMEGEDDKRTSLKAEFDKAKEQFKVLAEKREKEEMEKARKEEEEKAKKAGKKSKAENAPTTDGK